MTIFLKRLSNSIFIFSIFVCFSLGSWAQENPLPLIEKGDSESSAESTSAVIVNETVAPVSVNEAAVTEEAVREEASTEKLSSQDYVRMSWEASSKNELAKTLEVTEQCVTLYGEEAKTLEGQLTNFPSRDKIESYQVLNDVGTCLFIRAEALMNHGKTEEAKELFRKIIAEYPWSQAWDPRGWYWSVKEKSQASLNMLEGKLPEKAPVKKPKLEKKTLPTLAFKGKETVVDYTKFGKFLNVGTKDYIYEATDPKGLSDAVGEGIYPNTGAVLKDPNYKKTKEDGRLEGSHWDFVHSEDLEAAFYKWATASEPWGVKLFYLGLIFEKANMFSEAIKAYHAIVVHFPKSTGWTYWNTPWYPGQAAIAKIRHLVKMHPELNLKFKWAKIQVINGFDNNIRNDVVITYPGVIEKKDFWDKIKEKAKSKFDINRYFVKFGKVKKVLGGEEVRLVQYQNGHWQLLVEGKPYLIKGMTYAPTKVGQSPDKGTLVSWMEEDENNNGLPDGPYDAWVDKNRNNKQGIDELAVGDFQLMKDMGVNTMRIYHQPFKPNKKVLRQMYAKYGIRVIMGDFLGKYAFGSGASWYEGTDYENGKHKENMLNSIKEMVLEFKDEPYMLMWLLGNENNYGVACNADKKPDAYYQFVDEVARLIKSLDPHHPVAICNGDTLHLDIFAKYCPNVDAFAANAYRGDYGFGSFWEQVFDATGKAAFITEFGCPAYAANMTTSESEKAQADYHEGNWTDVFLNAAGTKEGVGNSIGAIVFEWIDEWWKNYEPTIHDQTAGAIGPFPDGYMYEELFGLCGQGDGSQSPFLRQLRESYFRYQKMWK